MHYLILNDKEKEKITTLLLTTTIDHYYYLEKKTIKKLNSTLDYTPNLIKQAFYSLYIKPIYTIINKIKNSTSDKVFLTIKQRLIIKRWLT